MFRRLSIISDDMVTMKPVVEPIPVPIAKKPTTKISKKQAVKKSTQIKKSLERKKSVNATPDFPLAK